jgi:ribosomal-protein-alanine N-acetyltransferase
MIRGKNVTLRTVRECDVDNLFAFLSDIENRGEYFGVMIPSEATFKKDFRDTGFWQEDFGRLLICDKEERVIGTIWYFTTTPYYDGLEIGYHMFDVASRNKGLMTESLSLLVRYLFATKKVNRLQLTVMLPNVASRRVAQKCGFKLEGIARGALFHKGRNHDLEMYSILRAEVNIV